MELYIGQVIDREDPEGLGRVQLNIHGVITKSAWAWPLGTLGGGSDRRGFFAVPEKDADVGVLFLGGRVDQPYYLCGPWSKPNGQTEVPEPLRGLTAKEAPQVRAFETGRFLLVFDDRSGSEKLLLKDKVNGDLITLDAGVGVQVKTTKDVTVEATGKVAISAKGDASVHADGDVTLTAGGSAKVDAGTQAVVSAPDVQLGGTNLLPPINGLVLGSGIDPFTGATYFVLGSASTVVKAKK